MSIDTSPITSEFTIYAVLIPVLQVATVLAAIIALLGSVALVYALIRGDELVRSDFSRLMAFRDELAFRWRYRRERRNRAYTAWKKRRGY
jgi:hypothetical protein